MSDAAQVIAAFANIAKVLAPPKCTTAAKDGGELGGGLGGVLDGGIGGGLDGVGLGGRNGGGGGRLGGVLGGGFGDGPGGGGGCGLGDEPQRSEVQTSCWSKLQPVPHAAPSSSAAHSRSPCAWHSAFATNHVFTPPVCPNLGLRAMSE
mmetsp:Transcript_17563/g.41664  ORF Transcript_17563/g.41664 Transcript_17563/m.41664 type:complete len:149 (+) Transcript_17563:460-906(+)